MKTFKYIKMKNLKFANGDLFPQMGLGTWLSKPNEVYEAVISAIQCGYRHIDCAAIYGNEKEIGKALNFALVTGLVKREELFITSKLWNSDHAPEQVEPAIRKTLADLQLDYLDLYLMHWPIAFKTGQQQAKTIDDLVSLDDLPLSVTWNAMVALQTKALTKHIGVSNFNIPKLQQLLQTSTYKPEVLQVELHPYLQQLDLLEFCNAHQILVTAYSPLGSRHLIQSEAGIHNESIIKDIAQKYKCSVTQVMLAWGVARKVAVIPKSVNASRIIDNFNAIEIQLDNNELLEIAKLERNLRNAKGLFAVMPNGPYTYESIWNE